MLDELRTRSTREHKSIGELASQLLAVALRRNTPEERTPSFRWESGRLGTPRVDLEDKEALHTLMDRYR